MQKKLMWLLMACLALSVFTSCSDSSDDSESNGLVGNTYHLTYEVLDDDSKTYTSDSGVESSMKFISSSVVRIYVSIPGQGSGERNYTYTLDSSNRKILIQDGGDEGDTEAFYSDDYSMLWYTARMSYNRYSSDYNRFSTVYWIRQ